MSIFIVCFFVFIFGLMAFFMNAEQKKSALFKVYISGPMTGYEDYNFPAFKECESLINIELKGINVINPVNISAKTENAIDNPKYEDYMREDLRALIDCDAVILLNGWKDSDGCLLEVNVAQKLNIPIFESISELKKYVEGKNECKN